MTGFRFGSFELHCASGELRKSGLRIHLEDQPFRLLAALVERQGELLTREELRTALWPDGTYVDFDRSLNRAINKVRLALGDSAANPRFIETLPRRGYRFVAPVARVDLGNEHALSALEATSPTEPVPPIAEQERASEPIPLPTMKPHHRWWAVGAVVALAAAATAIVSYERVKPISAIAVLPFEDMSGDPEQRYFADGMTDQLIADLSRIDSLRVISRQSVTHYDESSKTLSEIAGELNVGAIVEGSVARASERVRVNARLVRLPNEQVVWTRTYERNATDILTLQSELAQSIADQVGAVITPEEHKRLATQARPVDPELHALYLRGRFLALEPSLNMRQQGIQMLEEVVEKDPTYVPAHAALAEAWFQLSSFYLPPVEAMPKAKAAARKAIQLNPECDSARATLGRIHLFYDWDWQAAEEQLRTALDLNPNSSVAYRGLAGLRISVGRNDEALEAVEHGLRLDPMALWTRFESVFVYTLALRYDNAIRQARRNLDWAPGFALQRAVLGALYAEKGQFTDAVREAEAAVEGQRIPTTLSFLAHVYAMAGRRADAERVLAELSTLAEQQYVCPYEVATAFAVLGSSDDAFAWMDKGIASRADCMVWLRSEPWLESIRRDPRYSDLVSQVAFPQP